MATIKAWIILLVSAVFISSGSYAQKEMDNWFFGYNCGLSFSSGSAQFQAGGQVYSPEGCSSISDEQGSLLFYTDGIRVWNRNHQLMPNLSPQLTGDTISTQSAVIVKQPGSKFLYYIFTAGSIENNNAILSYSVVDMRLDNGLGDVVPSSKNIPLASTISEKVTAIKHANANDMWIVTHLFGTDEFLVFYLSCNGLKTPPATYRIGSVVNGLIGNALGYIKGSPDGKKLAIANLQNVVEVFDFDNETGVISNARPIGSNPGTVCRSYGLEFSPDSKLLYVSSIYNCGNVGDYDISQFQLSAADINATKFTLLTGRGYPPGALQLGPDDKIYIAFNNRSSLGAVNAPDVVGAGCGFVENQVSMPSTAVCGSGLPNAVSGFTRTLLGKDTAFCDAFSYNIHPLVQQTSFKWSDGSTDDQVVLQDYGKHWVDIETSEGCDYNDTIVVEGAFSPKPNLGADKPICDGQQVVLNANTDADNFLWQDGATGATYTVTRPGRYVVTASNVCGTVTDEIDITEGSCIPALPNAFTPDKATNNIFRLANSSGVTDFLMQIYNRWGQLVYRTNNAGEGWNGYSNGKMQPSGSYVFVVSYSDPLKTEKQFQKGTLLLIR